MTKWEDEAISVMNDPEEFKKYDSDFIGGFVAGKAHSVEGKVETLAKSLLIAQVQRDGLSKSKINSEWAMDLDCKFAIATAKKFYLILEEVKI